MKGYGELRYSFTNLDVGTRWLWLLICSSGGGGGGGGGIKPPPAKKRKSEPDAH
jgi:hypothetical protein